MRNIEIGYETTAPRFNNCVAAIMEGSIGKSGFSRSSDDPCPPTHTEASILTRFAAVPAQSGTVTINCAGKPHSTASTRSSRSSSQSPQPHSGVSRNELPDPKMCPIVKLSGLPNGVRGARRDEGQVYRWETGGNRASMQSATVGKRNRRNEPGGPSWRGVGGAWRDKDHRDFDQTNEV